ncbi:MAG: hypothetical protein FIA89_00840 [Geobacter sp.]|nr:hypothetical protein [Geobacter sp.]
MLVELTNHETNEKLQIEAGDICVDELKKQFKANFSKDDFMRIIDNLNVSADAKLLLIKLLDITITVGAAVLDVGKKIIEIIKAVTKNFPHITAGMIIAAILSLLIGCIPVLGPLLSWLCTPLFLAVGVGIGILKDIDNTDLGRALNEVVDTIFAGLKNIPVPSA